ncbi:MAG: hypothetical protein E6Q34_09435 [Burkholderiaceae bacterium]|nr:MAG: hypothetical protein E6Q34_09435 [Burkholderiaceae bacterium]
MSLKLSNELLEHVRNYDEFIDLALAMGDADRMELFEFLFSRAMSGGRVGAIAARLLVEIEPKPTRNCEELLDEVAKSNWNVSVKEVPFYFISQFGKRGLISAYENYINDAILTDMQKQRVGTIIYWTAGSTANLIRGYHDWPWLEAEDEARG